MSGTRRIGILTGGGDVPGLNSVIKSVVYRSTELGFEVLGIRRGWEGLTHLRPGNAIDRDHVVPLDRANTRAIDRTGGTMLHTSRTNPGRTRPDHLPEHLRDDAARYANADGSYDLTPVVVDNLARLGIDQLVALLVADKQSNPSRYAFVIAAEGAAWIGRKVGELGEPDAFGHRRKADIGELLAEEIKRRSGEDTIVSQLTYDLRSGDPDAFDQMVGTTFANIAVDLIAEGLSGRMTAIRGGRYTHIAVPDPARGPRTVDVERYYNAERLRPRYTGRNGFQVMLSPCPPS